MALTNTLVVDLAGQTVTLNCNEGANLVENLIYTLSSNTVTFGIRPAVTISATDYIGLLAQLALFQTAIINSFPINQFATQPFSSCLSNETFVTFINQWELQVTVNGTLFISDSTSHSSGNTSFNDRVSPQVINYGEWVLVFNAKNHYGISIKNFLGI